MVKTPFYGGFGLIAAGGIPKPSFYAFQVLHELGDRRIENSNPNILVTKARDGSLVVAVWNLVNPGASGQAKTFRLNFKGVKPKSRLTIAKVDEQHGDTLALYQKMGSPLYPTTAQIQQLIRESKLPEPEAANLTGDSLAVEVPVNGLLVLHLN